MNRGRRARAIALDKDGNWRLIKVHPGDQTIRFARYAGQPFCVDFTDEMIEYVRDHPWRT